MAVTAKMVKELREMTGAGMMDCKKALNETDGNMDAEAGVNISDMTNKSKKEYAYTMIDIEGGLNEEIKEKLGTIKDVLRVRVIE